MIAAVSMVKDEADIVELTVRRMATQVDFLIVADNTSTDGTREILARLAGELPLTVIDDPEVGYYQSFKMSRLADAARDQGADWVIPFDADEVWLARDGRRVADVLDELPENVLIAAAALYDHVATGLDPAADPVKRMAWRRAAAAPLPKVACRPLPGVAIHQGNHGAGYDHSDHPPTVANLLTVRHFPYRSAAQMVSKARNGAAAYAATRLNEDTGAHWRGFGRILAEHGEEGIGDVFRKWYWRADPREPIVIDGEHQEPLVHDPCPA